MKIKLQILTLMLRVLHVVALHLLILANSVLQIVMQIVNKAAFCLCLTVYVWLVFGTMKSAY